MEGKILFYNETSGEGLILSEDKKKYKLKAEHWEDFDNMPSTGQKVDFYPDNKDALNVVIHGNNTNIFEDEEDIEIKLQEATNKKPSSNKKQKKITLKDNQKVEDKNLKDIIPTTTVLPKKKDNNEKLSSNINKANFQYNNKDLDKKDEEFDKLSGINYIPITKSFKDTFFSYFQDAIRISQSNKVEDSEDTLSYPQMRRFLITAYEHLLDKDPTFINKDLVALRRNLEDTYMIYKDIKEKLSLPNAKFETVFLPQQEIYNLVMRKIQANTKRVGLLTNLIEDLDESLKRQEEELKNFNKSSNDYYLKDIAIKKLRTRCVNGIDELNILKNENVFLENISKDFINKHKIDFLDYFMKNGDELLLKITTNMNKNAYKFDTYMWNLAKKSKAIKTFFIEAQVDGGFCSKTFLKYFLKNLDNTKLNREYKELQRLLDYLDELDKKHIVIIDDQSFVMPHLIYFTNHINKYYNVHALSPTEAVYKMSDFHIDYIIVDVHIKKIKLFDFIDRVKQYYKDTQVILISDAFTRDILLSAKKKGIQYFVATNVSDTKLSKTLGGIISGKREQKAKVVVNE
jgi:CheY-like chemotaxis protein